MPTAGRSRWRWTAASNTCSPPDLPARSARYALQELEPRLFSFNNPMGACPKCDGLGVIQFSTRSASSQPGAVAGRRRDPRLGPPNQFYFQIVESLGRITAFGRCAVRRIAENSSGDSCMAQGAPRSTPLPQRKGDTRFDRSHTFEGIIPNLERRYRGSDSPPVREELSKFISNTGRPGARLALRIGRARVGARTLHEISRLPLGEARTFFQLPGTTGQARRSPTRSQGNHRPAVFLINVGLDYLCLERSAETLSGGEAAHPARRRSVPA